MLNTFELHKDEEALAGQVYDKAIEIFGINAKDIDIDITILTLEEMQTLNLDARGIDKATDVLSFPFVDVKFPFVKSDYSNDINPESGAVYLGEIMICRQVMAEQASEYNHSQVRELGYLIVHGISHLMGYNHITEEDKCMMRDIEEKILSSLNITRL